MSFRELATGKTSGNPCCTHTDGMCSPSELGYHDHHLWSLKDSEICHPVLQVSMEYNPKAVHVESLKLIDVENVDIQVSHHKGEMRELWPYTPKLS